MIFFLFITFFISLNCFFSFDNEIYNCVNKRITYNNKCELSKIPVEVFSKIFLFLDKNEVLKINKSSKMLYESFIYYMKIDGSIPVNVFFGYKDKKKNSVFSTSNYSRIILNRVVINMINKSPSSNETADYVCEFIKNHGDNIKNITINANSFCMRFNNIYEKKFLNSLCKVDRIYLSYSYSLPIFIISILTKGKKIKYLDVSNVTLNYIKKDKDQRKFLIKCFSKLEFLNITNTNLDICFINDLFSICEKPFRLKVSNSIDFLLLSDESQSF